VNPKSFRRDVVFAGVVFVYWAILIWAGLTYASPGKECATWLLGGLLGTVLIYYIRMFLGGLLFSETTQEMELPPKIGRLAFGLIVVVGVITVVLIGLALLKRNIGHN
jgi:hypothetical protein